jgi:hypothetical protein
VVGRIVNGLKPNNGQQTIFARNGFTMGYSPHLARNDNIYLIKTQYLG